MATTCPALRAHHLVGEPRHFGLGRITRHIDQSLVPAGIVKARGDQPLRAEVAHIAERHCGAGRLLGLHSITSSGAVAQAPTNHLSLVGFNRSSRPFLVSTCARADLSNGRIRTPGQGLLAIGSPPSTQQRVQTSANVPASAHPSLRALNPATRATRLITVDEMRQPDPITLHRVGRLLAAVGSLLGSEITTAWLARTLVRVDRGPMLNAPRLGPALRTLGFQPVRRRGGTRRVSTWMRPGAPVPRAGRPRVQERLTG
jgi:hypothetical protein